MPAVSSLTLGYDSILSTTLFNVKRELQDEISTSNILLFMMMRKDDTYKSNDAIGDRMQIPLMYALAPADSYSGYDILDTSPFDGITSAFFDWRQFATHVAISALEEKKNKGDAAILKLLTAKTKQATLGIQDKFARALMQGQGANDGTSITTAYVSPSNGSSFIDPLFLLVKFDPASSTVIGNINQQTYTWWRNQTKDVTAVNSYEGFLKSLRNLYNNCGKGPGGYPNLLVSDQGSFELYEAALSKFHQNPSYGQADIPFENVKFRGGAWAWDEFIPDVKNGTVAITKGTVGMFNTKFFGMEYDSDTDFEPQGFIKPDNQDAKVNHILWLGALAISQRRKQGVMGGVDLTIAA